MFRKFENLIRPFENVPAGTPPAKLWPYMVQQLAPFKKWLPWMAITGVLVALMESGLIFYSGRIIDLMGASSPDAFWAQHGFELILVIIFILFLRPVIITLNHFFLEQTLASNLQDQTRWRAHKHMLGQSSSFFQNDFAGRLTNRVMQLGPAVEDSTYMAFEGIWYATTYVLGAILILTQIDIRLGAPLAIWLVLYILYVRRIAVRVSVASEKWSAARSLVTGRVVDAYSNIETVKLFAHGASEEAYALSALRRLRLRFQRFLRLMTEMSFGLNLLNGALMVGVVGPAIWLWMNGHVTIGEVAAASALTIRLNGMSGWIMWVTIRLFEHAGVIREGLESIAKPQAVVDAPRAPEMVVEEGAIHIKGLSHHYGKDQGGLNGIDLHIPAGQRVGLIGRSGAGKSSLVNLLLRFRDAEQGEITIDGQNVSDVTQDSLRRQIGMVTQDSSLLHRSVRANLLYGRPDASEDEMIAAAQKAEAHEFILDLEDPKGRKGYSAHVGERGVKLSGGQRQRVAIARVILKDAPILILDEATSALDSQVEAAIQDTLFDIMENKTVIAIAHRLSTIAQMDRIVVLDDGAVVEDGSHEELLASGGIYAELWARQSGGFLGVDQ
ncbi:multidrug ABC transporter ATP-binding protein [Amylibacter kogurei]|uniref:Multidrug ABC transporter ATP-binding protein n=1 Tax=Paramylibacter kogurei TaxID=1889778 RepID=A0A2G5K871_9RHOB|nr:ABC transporter ATP-binding protein [Amylibacter kogurei]PIB25726.1 multidrug ABC transporter ATP-binding protein [Amylibacter kogurei]